MLLLGKTFWYGMKFRDYVHKNVCVCVCLSVCNLRSRCIKNIGSADTRARERDTRPSRVSLPRAPRNFFGPYRFFTRLPRRLSVCSLMIIFGLLFFQSFNQLFKIKLVACHCSTGSLVSLTQVRLWSLFGAVQAWSWRMSN